MTIGVNPDRGILQARSVGHGAHLVRREGCPQTSVKQLLLVLVRIRRIQAHELERALERIRPRLHVFGHIHESYGTHRESGVLSINACNCDPRYRPVNPPVVVDWDGDEVHVLGAR